MMLMEEYKQVGLPVWYCCFAKLIVVGAYDMDLDLLVLILRDKHPGRSGSSGGSMWWMASSCYCERPLSPGGDLRLAGESL